MPDAMRFPITAMITITIFVTTFSASHQRTLERTAFDEYTPLLRQIRKLFIAVMGRPTHTARSLQTVRSRNKLQKQMDGTINFPCSLNNARSEKRPSSVHALRPGDIDVIGGIGDSLTAGFGLTATSLATVFVENRGIAFSSGGQGSWRNFLTLPNILKVFNPKLHGYALGDYFTIDKESRFNVAEGAAISDNMPYMAKVLVNRIKMDPKVDLKNDWKMITFSIGANDFCTEMCYREKPESILEDHKEDVIDVLRILRDNLPRTFVNLVPPPNLEIISRFTHKPPQCYVTHSVECPCIFGLSYTKYQKRFGQIIRKWQKIEEDVVNMDEFDTDDFTVVYQPFTEEYAVPKTKEGKTDLSFLSEDCFHLSQKGNAQAANSLWNNIMEPVGRKDVHGTMLFKKFRCPTANHLYLFTRRNSKL
ncbi:phospholipase B1, membrane-associated-like [Agrilus planipennis]|uniref:Phospholipase B1, membrane-associated n=1 Tax=Agrilus planipennis TaxID=224129 RepID=A0A1W4WEJ9_AGRPL|nr:phospholipase B1, membrane-associated-like [Agrilus planipennis]